MWMKVSALGFLKRRFLWGFATGIKTARKKVASTKHFIISQGGRAGDMFLQVQSASQLFWDCILLGLFGLGCAVTYSGVISNGHGFQLLGRLLPWVESGPPRFIPELSQQPFSMGTRVYLQCKCIIKSLEVMLGQRWKRRVHVYSCLMICHSQGFGSLKVRMLYPQASDM